MKTSSRSRRSAQPRFPSAISFAGTSSIRPKEAGQEIESRNRLSHIGVFDGQRQLFLQPHLVYPAPWTSEPLKDFVDRTAPLLPFRLRDQYFKRWLVPAGRVTTHGRL